MSINSLRHLLVLICCCSLALGAQNPTNDRKYCLDDVDLGQFTQIGNKFYHFSEHKATWFRSFLECRSLMGHLASFDTDEELTAISQYLQVKFKTPHKWWVSAADLNIDGEFHWYGTGKRFNYTSLAFRKPSSWKKVEQCGHLYFNNNRYQVNDSKCKDQEYYVCDLDEGRVESARMRN